jgi:hypothetical protein
LATVPEAKRQPTLLLGAVRLLGGPVDNPAALRDFIAANWSAIEANLRTKATQTNEAGRCALLLPCWKSVPPPAWAATPTATPTGTVTTRSERAVRSSTARSPEPPTGPAARGGLAGRPGPEPAASVNANACLL